MNKEANFNNLIDALSTEFQSFDESMKIIQEKTEGNI